MIQISDLQITFSPGTALQTQVFSGLSLLIPAGQFVTVIGSNGAGKSTLLNAISGAVIPQGGRILVAGYDITEWPIAKRAKLVSRVFQNPLAGSCAELTLEENLVLAQRRARTFSLKSGFKPALSQSVRSQFRERLASLSLGIENRLGDRMGLLSGGQRQAASLVMATLAPTQVLLLDEHTAALDPKTASEILSLTRQLVVEKQLTTLMVTHSMQQALDLGDRTLMLHEGRPILDIAGTERQGLTVNDLLNQFERKRAKQSDPSTSALNPFDEDALLLE